MMMNPLPPSRGHRNSGTLNKNQHSFLSLALMTCFSLALLVVNVNYTSMLQNQARVYRDIYRPASSSSSTTTQEITTESTLMAGLRPILHRKLIQADPSSPPPKVLAGDAVYYRDTSMWDSTPVVIESHKLLFFTVPKVGCTVWKQLFRRMHGRKDYLSQERGLPHDPRVNGLKYLYDYTPEQATKMMTDPTWTRAMMVRDPKLRYLSAFLDKSVSNNHEHIRLRCCRDSSCVDGAQTIAGFVDLTKRCHDGHWKPQTEWVDRKFWPYLDQVLHLETAAADAKKLLQTIGAWEEYGKSGWDGGGAIFGSTEMSGAGNHATWSSGKVWQWYQPETELLVEQFYRADYEHPLFNFTHYNCLTCPVVDTKE